MKICEYGYWTIILWKNGGRSKLVGRLSSQDIMRIYHNASGADEVYYIKHGRYV